MRRAGGRARIFPTGLGVTALVVSFIGFPGQGAVAETLNSALARAYSGNPEINQQRSGVRAQDEDTTNALAGMRPKAGLAASIGPEFSTIKIPSGRTATGQRAYFADEYLGKPRSATLSVSQTIFDGGRTQSAVRQAESGVFAARANLGASEQTILQNGVIAYMDVLRDTAILGLRKNNNAVLEEQLRHTRVRYQFGEVTAADVAQAEAALAHGRSDFYGAQAVLQMSGATYRQVVGVEPKRLEPAGTVEKLLPKSMEECGFPRDLRASGGGCGAASGRCGGGGGETGGKRFGADVGGRRASLAARGFFYGLDGHPAVLCSGGGDAECPPVSGRLGICLDPQSQGTIGPSAIARRRAAGQRAQERRLCLRAVASGEGVDCLEPGGGRQLRKNRSRMCVKRRKSGSEQRWTSSTRNRRC